MHNRFLFGLLPLIGLGCLLVAVVKPKGPGLNEYVSLGILFGTMFSHATLASAWTALGPLALVWRLPLSLAWLAALLIALAFDFAHGGGPPGVLPLISGCLVGQWLVLQLPLWGLAIGYGLRVRLRGEVAAGGKRENQFGIRQLMIITAIVAVVLGVARAVVLSVAPKFDNTFGGEAAIFIFLAAAGILMTLPLVLAALLPRYAAWASFVVLALVALGTTWEVQLLSYVWTGAGPDFFHFAFINGFQAAWVLAIIGLLRLGGYGLFPPDEARNTVSTS